MLLVIEQFLNGLQFGLLLFLLAAGLTLVFGIMDLVNLAHGSLYMMGAYFAATFVAWTGNFLIGVILALGATLLVPIIPSAVAGAGLTAFSGGLLGLYARTPGMRKEGSPFPTQQGIALAKDVWMMGIGLGLVIDDLTDRLSSD